MKRITAMALCLVLALSLAGCGAASSGTGSPIAGGADRQSREEFVDGEETQNAAFKINGTSQEINVLKEPPALTVIYGEKNDIEALRGTFSWMHQNEDDTWTGIEADSVHPLEAKEYMPSLALLPLYTSNPDPSIAHLQWNTAPDKISVRCWDEKNLGQPDAESEELQVCTLMVDSNIVTAPIPSIELKDGNFIYEMIAEWSSSENYNGTACYSFYTVK